MEAINRLYSFSGPTTITDI